MVKTYILDPGHGNGDVGTRHNGITEVTFVYRVCEKAKTILEERGHRVLLTHAPDEDPSHTERAQLAIDARAVGTILVHVNAGACELEHGPLAFHNRNDDAGRKAALLMIQRIGRDGYYVKDNRVRKMRMHVHDQASPLAKWTPHVWACLKPHALPAVLLECEYCTHAESARWLKDNLMLLAETIADGAEALG
jgi:N-acetylmuramoyl-L-alanine amidase